MRRKGAEARSLAFISKYGAVQGAGAPPTLMLDYLLEDSAEIAQLRGSLGTLGTVRKLFERLNDLVADHRADRTSAVQRIVITIDDLDRCSERQVVQILEAIHLLLAFPCFVVVAACDARWLETALITAHTQLVPVKEEDAPRSDYAATPADYLEKIFQIAYWVRPFKASLTSVVPLRIRLAPVEAFSCPSVANGLSSGSSSTISRVKVAKRAPVKVSRYLPSAA